MNNQFFTLQKLYINDYDLNGINIISLGIFYNIEQIGSSLEIIFNDTTDIRNKLPIKGGEIIDILIVDRFDNKFKKKFILTKIFKVNDMNEYNQVYKIQALSYESFKLGINRDYSCYTNTVSNIVAKYIQDIEDLNKTHSINQIIIPGFTHIKSIQYMIDNFTKDHICFEKNENFVFSSLKDLLVKSENTYKYDTQNPYYRYNIIEDIELNNFNTIKEANKNIYNNTYVTYNPNNKSIESINKSIEDEIDTSLGKGLNYSEQVKEDINTKYNLIPYSYDALNNSNRVYNHFNKKREALLNGDLNIQIGDVIELNLLERYGNQTKDKLLGGDYLISKVAHHFNSESYYTKVEVLKNSYYKI